MYNNVYNFKYTRQLFSNNYEAIINTSITYARHFVVVDKGRHAYNRFSLILQNETINVLLSDFSLDLSARTECTLLIYII